MIQEPTRAPASALGEGSPGLARYYSVGQIAAAAFLGAPPAAGILLASNFMLFGNRDVSRQCLFWGWFSIVPLFAISLVLPENFPNSAMPAAYTAIIHHFAKRTQSSALTRIVEQGAVKQSHWRVFGIGLACLAVDLTATVAAFYLLPESWLPAAA